jgi:hypothetical protein
MRVMGAQTPDERLESRMDELAELNKRVEGEMRRIKAALRRTNPNGRPPGPRPPCDTERGYQRHYREGEHCDRCLAAHRRHERARYAARKLAESPVETDDSTDSTCDNGLTNQDGPRAASSPVALTAGGDIEGLARRYEGAPN